MKRKLVWLLAVTSFISLVSALYINFASDIFKSNLSAQAFDEPSCTSGYTTPQWNPLSLNLTTGQVDLNTCRGIPMLTFSNETVTTREVTLTSGSVNIQVYYNPQGPTNSITQPRLKIETTEITPTQYKVSAKLEGTNISTYTSTSQSVLLPGGTHANGESLGDLIINIPSGKVLEPSYNTARIWPQAPVRFELSQIPPAPSPSDQDPNSYPSAITVFENSPVQPPAINADGFNLSYKDDDLDAENDADTPDALAGGLTNYGLYTFGVGITDDPTPLSNVYLSEINWAGTSADFNDQWLEIYNPSETETVDLTGVEVTGAGGGTSSLFLTNISCSNLEIGPKEYFLLAKYAETDSRTLLNTTPDCININLDINKLGENFSIKKNAQVLDSVVFI